MHLAASIVAAFVLCAPASVAGSLASVHAVGELVTGRIDLTGETFVSGRPGLLGLDARWGAQDAILEGSASQLAVNWTQAHRTVFAPAVNANSWLLGVSKGPVEQGERTFADVTWALHDFAPDANVLVEATDANLMGEFPRGLVVRAAASDAWHAGNGPTAGAGADDSPLAVSRPVAAGMPVVFASEALAKLRGAFNVYVWGVNVTVTNADGTRHAFRSGTWWTESSGPDSDGIHAEEHSAFLQMAAVDAEVVVQIAQGFLRATLDAPSLDTAGFFDARVHEATLESGDQTHSIHEQDLRVAGRIALAPRASGASGLLKAAVAFEGTALADGRPFLAASANPTAMPDLPAPLALVLAGVTTVGLLGFLVSRRGDRRESLLLKAEQDLSLRRAGAARAHARRLLRHNELDSEAWFLYATGLLQSGDADAVVRQVEPMARRLPDSCRTGLAFVIALAHVRLRQHRRAVAWLEVACIDPVLREHVRAEPAFADLRTLPKYRRMLSDVVPGYG